MGGGNDWRAIGRAVMVARFMRARISLLILTFAIASCNSGSTPTSIPRVVTTTRSAPEISTTTTTGSEAFRLVGAPPGWERLVASAYGRACEGDRTLMPVEIAALPEAEGCPQGGVTSTAVLDRWSLAVTEIGQDVFYGVGGEAGWNLAAARIPSLNQQTGWYGVVPKMVVAVGSDARPGQEPTSSRADSIHLLGLDGRGTGGVLGIPRDSWVTISGGGRNKVNASLSLGGPDVMLQTLADISGLNLDGYVLTGFLGFQEMLGNVLGGVDVELPAPVVDRASGASLSAGPQYLNGPQALALARARKSLDQGDLSRQLNGGMLLLAALQSAQAYGPGHLPELIAESAAWMTTDLSLEELLSFAALALDTPLDAIGNKVVPATMGTAGTASVVYLTDGAPKVFADLADGSLTP